MRLVDFFFALRPLVLVPAWSFFLFGFGMARAGDPGAQPFPGLRFASLSLVLAGVYLVNQVVDFESDRINGKGFFLQRGLFSRRLYVAAALACLAGGLGIVVVRGDSAGWMIAAALLGLAYSVPPLRLAARPGLDLLANAAGYGGIALALGAGDGFAGAVRWTPRVLAAAAAVAAVFLHTTLLDLEGDRRTGKRTSGVALGPAASRGLAFACACTAAAAAGATRVPPLAAATVALAVLCGAAAARPELAGSRTVCVGGSAAFVLAATWYVPAFGVAIAVLALVTRFYYRRRFALAYPAL